MDVSNIIPYSPIIMMAQENPEYSVWNPATNSDSASGRSKGALFDSASEQIKKNAQTIINTGIWKTFQERNPFESDKSMEAKPRK